LFSFCLFACLFVVLRVNSSGHHYSSHPILCAQVALWSHVGQLGSLTGKLSGKHFIQSRLNWGSMGSSSARAQGWPDKGHRRDPGNQGTKGVNLLAFYTLSSCSDFCYQFPVVLGLETMAYTPSFSIEFFAFPGY
jgi:hypothetical protein